MKINPSAFEQYKNYAKAVKNDESSSKGASAAKAAVQSGKTDTVSFSEEAAAHAEASRLSASIAAEVQAGAGAEKLGELRAAVQAGTYYVPSEKIADAILGAAE